MRPAAQLLNVQSTLLAELQQRGVTRDDIATTYAFAITSDEPINFEVINHAIVDKWSVAALRYIKSKAWKIAEGKA